MCVCEQFRSQSSSKSNFFLFLVTAGVRVTSGDLNDEVDRVREGDEIRRADRQARRVRAAADGGLGGEVGAQLAVRVGVSAPAQQTAVGK